MAYYIPTQRKSSRADAPPRPKAIRLEWIMGQWVLVREMPTQPVNYARDNARRAAIAKYFPTPEGWPSS